MGFFALRKPEQSSLSLKQDDPLTPGLSEKSVAQFIRSRLIGKRKLQVKPDRTNSVFHASPSESSDNTLPRKQEQDSVRSAADPSQLSRQSHQTDGLRTSSDVVTMTLAQRLNELATAHADGVISDDDYRILRQNLFTSFAPHSAPPVETPVVKSVEPLSLRHPHPSTYQSDRSAVDSTRAPSVLSRTSRTSVSTLFRRLRKRSDSRDEQDGASIISFSSWLPSSPVTTPVGQPLSRQASTNSLRTVRSRIPPDLQTVSSIRLPGSRANNLKKGVMSRGSSRSLRSNGPPPSSYNAKLLSSRFITPDSGGELFQSAAEIRAEIRATEIEQQNVLNTFSLLAQSRLENSVGYNMAPTSRVGAPGPLSSTPGLYKHFNRSASDSRSNTARLMHAEMPVAGQDINEHGSLHDWSEFMAEMQGDGLEQRMTEISMRYQQRLDYLRARLKGAEIHERLLRK